MKLTISRLWSATPGRHFPSNLLIVIAMIAATVCLTAAQTKPTKQPRNLAILIFDGVQIIDYTGPYETFGHTYSNDGEAFNIYTVSEKTTPITTSMGMSVNPKYNFENAPEPNLLLVPGGNVEPQLKNPAVLKWVGEKAKNAEIVMSVCNGAFILAKVGLLDGLEATTTSNLIPLFREAAPKVKVVDDRRFVDTGKIITTAGLSSGIDGALHVIARLYGLGTAQIAALGMEYNWDPESKFVRATLADKYLRFNYDVKVQDGGWKPTLRTGNADKWENTWDVTTESSATGLLETINSSISAHKIYGAPMPRWSQIPMGQAKDATRSQWQFTDEKGNQWKGWVEVNSIAGEANRFKLTVRIARSPGDNSVSRLR